MTQNLEELARLRAKVEDARQQLVEAEANLAEQRLDIEAFEFEYQARVGVLLAQLEQIDAEVKLYLDRIQQQRNERTFGTAFSSVEEQYRQTWQAPRQEPSRPKPAPISENSAAQIKNLYRQLARRYHPDLAADEAERAHRTEMMTAVNDAYAARSLAELLALAKELENKGQGVSAVKGQTGEDMVQALSAELQRIQRRLRQIDLELHSLHTHHLVELSLEAKFAQQKGRDILAEMTAEIERRIARKTVERDMIKTQFDNL